MDEKHAKTDLQKVAAKTKQLTAEQAGKLEQILRRHETLFNGTLYCFKNTQYHIELEQDHAKPYAVPKGYETTF